MNNPIQLMRAFRNPQEFLKQYEESQNPMVQNAIRMYRNGDREGINKMASNLCKEKGIDMNQFIQQIKSQIENM